MEIKCPHCGEMQDLTEDVSGGWCPGEIYDVPCADCDGDIRLRCCLEVVNDSEDVGEVD